DGPRGEGHRLDPISVLLHPSTPMVSDGAAWGKSIEVDRQRSIRRGLFLRRNFDWREDAPPLTPLEDSIIYELHVRGFTCDPSSGVAKPGTFAGLADKVPYLKDLGITAVELLPVFEFDEDDCVFIDPASRRRLR